MKKIKSLFLRIKFYRLWVHLLHNLSRSKLGKFFKRNRLAVFLMFLLVCVAAYFFAKVQIMKQKEMERLPVAIEDRSARHLAGFIDVCFGQINGNYRLGNNSALRGMKETRTWTNEYNDISNVQLSVHLFIAKENFERMMNEVKKIGFINEKTEKIKELLLTAATTRIEAIDLISKGFLLKERIGKTMISNLMADKREEQRAALLPIPEYTGEIESGLGKIPIGNTYVVDALKLLKSLADEIHLTKFYDVKIANTVGYYADALEGDFNSYAKEGRFYLENEDYFSAVIASSRALKIEPTDRDVLVNLIQAYLGLGGESEAKTFLELALKSYPGDKEILELRAKIPGAVVEIPRSEWPVVEDKEVIQEVQPAVQPLTNKVLSEK